MFKNLHYDFFSLPFVRRLREYKRKRNELLRIGMLVRIYGITVKNGQVEDGIANIYFPPLNIEAKGVSHSNGLCRISYILPESKVRYVQSAPLSKWPFATHDGHDPRLGFFLQNGLSLKEADIPSYELKNIITYLEYLIKNKGFEKP